MDRADAKSLKAGSAEHYSSYVGPPDQYDFMYHPRQDWYVFALDPERLPSKEDAAKHLTGRVLGDPSLQRRSV